MIVYYILEPTRFIKSKPFLARYHSRLKSRQEFRGVIVCYFYHSAQSFSCKVGFIFIVAKIVCGGVRFIIIMFEFRIHTNS